MKKNLIFVLFSMVAMIACNNNFCDSAECGANASCDEDTESCICDAGWLMGPDGLCDQQDLCYNVDCGPNGIQCNPETGACECADGWTGANCDQQDLCLGKDCGPNSIDCDPETGICICEFGWYSDGGNCNKYNACVANGTVCDSPNTVCNENTGECECTEGWYGINCDSQNPCDEVNIEPCPENSSCITLEENGITIAACQCDEGYELNEAADGCVAISNLSDYVGTYIQNDQDCNNGADFPNVATVTVVEDPLVENGLIFQGFSGIDGGHDVKVSVNGVQFMFSPNPQTITNLNGTEVTFESLTIGSYNVGQLNGQITLAIQYRLTSVSSDECFAVLIKQ